MQDEGGGHIQSLIFGAVLCLVGGFLGILGILADIVEAYRARLMDHLGVVKATVTTAHVLPAERAANIERSLAHASGRQVILTTEVDPALLGGLVAKVGSTVYDASVARNLERIRQTLWER